MNLKHAICLVLLLLSRGLTAEDTYKIKLDRPAKKGEKYCLEVNLTNINTFRVTEGGKVTKNTEDKEEYHLKANVTVLESDQEKQTSTIKLDIHSFTHKKPQFNEDYEFLKKGVSVILKKTDNKTTSTIDNIPLDDRTASALNELMSKDKTSVQDEVVFGTAQEKKIGDTWEINKKAAIADLTKKGATLNEEDLNGSVTLVKKVPLNGIETLLIKAEVSTDNLMVPAIKKYPPGTNIEASQLRAGFSGHFPVDLTIPRQTYKFEMSGFFDIVIPENDSALHLKIKMMHRKDLRKSEFKELRP